MTADEVACGGIFGPGDDRPRPLPRRISRRRSARRVMEDVLREALARPPCIVEFSGGRDSSALLAVAVALARREGLPPPIPVTHRFSGLEEADEAAWQEELVRWLGLADWVRLEVTDQLDLVGPVAGASLRRHGLLWPPLLYVRAHLLSHARGGSSVSGEGGDEIFGPRRLTPLRQVVRGIVPLDRRTVRAAALSLAPAQVRRRGWRAAVVQQVTIPWLVPAMRRELTERVLAELAEEPLDWRRSLLAHLASPGVVAARRNLDLVAAEHDVLCIDPFLDLRFVDAVCGSAGVLGYRDRSAAMAALFGDVLPPAVVTRGSKARFNRAFFNRYSRAFVEGFDGTGVDTGLVDAEVLLGEWRSAEPNALSFALLQASWLAADGSAART